MGSQQWTVDPRGRALAAPHPLHVTSSKHALVLHKIVPKNEQDAKKAEDEQGNGQGDAIASLQRQPANKLPVSTFAKIR